MFSLDDFGTPASKPRSSASRTEPSEQFKHNILKQLDLFNGKKVLSATGAVVQPTWKEVEPGVILYGLKFGGAFVQLDGNNTHWKVPKDTFAERLAWLAEQAEEGWFDLQLNAISKSIRQRLQSGKKSAILTSQEVAHV